MTLKRDIEELIIKCGQKCKHGQGRCFMCGCQTAKRGMVVHHRRYLVNNDVIYSDKKYLPHNDTHRKQYLTDLYPLIFNNPDRFMFLCNTHHHALGQACRYGDKLWNKLNMARKMTKT